MRGNRIVRSTSANKHSILSCSVDFQVIVIHNKHFFLWKALRMIILQNIVRLQTNVLTCVRLLLLLLQSNWTNELILQPCILI